MVVDVLVRAGRLSGREGRAAKPAVPVTVWGCEGEEEGCVRVSERGTMMRGATTTRGSRANDKDRGGVKEDEEGVLDTLGVERTSGCV